MSMTIVAVALDAATNSWQWVDREPDAEINLSNHNAHAMLDELGLGAEAAELGAYGVVCIPLDDFGSAVQRWRARGVPDAGEAPRVDAAAGRCTIVHGGRRPGYYDDLLQRIDRLLHAGRDKGATHCQIG